MELFKIFGTLVLQGKEDFDKDVEDAASKGESLSSKIGKGLGTVAKVGAAAIGAAATAVGTLTKASIESYAEYEQLAGGSKLLFGDAYDFIAKKASSAFADVQMSQNEYLQQVNGFAVGLKTALDGDTQAAAELADKIITAEADIVAATGNSQEAVQNAFNGIMKSNFTMLDNLQLGITPTKEGFQEVIDKVNEWNKANGQATSYQIDNLADCQAALVDYVEMQGLAGYAANEGASTLQGSTSAMKAAWQNLMAGLADDSADFGSLMENFVTSGVTVLQNFLPRIQTIFNAIPQLISGLAPQIPVVIQSLLPGLLEGAISLVNGLVEAPEILSALLAVIPILLQGVEQTIQALGVALPQIINTIITFITDPATLQMVMNAAIMLLTSIVNAIPQIVTFLGESLPNIIQTLVSFFTDPGNFQMLFDAAITALLAIVNAIPQIISSLIGALPQIENTIIAFLTDPGTIQMLTDAAITLLMALIDAVPTITLSMLEAAPQIIMGLIQGLINAVPALLESIGQIGVSLWNKFKEVLGIGGDGGSTVAQSQGDALVAGFEKGIENLPGKTDSVFAQVGTNITKNLEETKKKVSTDSAEISSSLTAAGQNANTGFAEGFGEIGTAASTSLADASAVVTSKTMEINSTLDSQLTTAQTTTEDKFEAIKKTASDKMSEMVTTAEEAVQKVVAAFNVDLKFRSVTVPNFKLLGKFNTETGEVPTVKADPKVIYFAEGGIVDQATVFGMYGNRPMVAGEKGKEAIAPIDTLQTYVSQAVANQNAGLIDALDRILNAIVNLDENMGGNMRDALDGTALSINNREFGRLVRGVV